MAFTAADVKKLREMTSVGMMDCKKALTEADGDFDKAIELLREKGLAKAAKKADRIAAEGLVKATVCDECGVGAGDVFLHLLQHGIEVPALCRRGKEQIVRLPKCANVGVQGPLRRVVQHDGDNLRLRGDLIFRRVPPLRSCGKDRAVSLFAKSHIKTPPR